MKLKKKKKIGYKFHSIVIFVGYISKMRFRHCFGETRFAIMYIPTPTFLSLVPKTIKANWTAFNKRPKAHVSLKESTTGFPTRFTSELTFLSLSFSRSSLYNALLFFKFITFRKSSFFFVLAFHELCNFFYDSFC